MRRDRKPPGGIIAHLADLFKFTADVRGVHPPRSVLAAAHYLWNRNDAGEYFAAAQRVVSLGKNSADVRSFRAGYSALEKPKFGFALVESRRRGFRRQSERRNVEDQGSIRHDGIFERAVAL